MQKRSIYIKILTLFPDFVEQYTRFGIIAKAIKNKFFKFKAVNLRNFASDRRGTVDDRPYGGGVGMVLRPDVLHTAIRKTQSSRLTSNSSHVILLTPSGKQFKQKDAARLSKYDELIFVSGRYEGYDERITKFVDEEISIGDYVLMGGELPALVITEAVIRLLPGVIGKIESTENESFSFVHKTHGREKQGPMLEYPQYTKPEIWNMKHGAGSKKAKMELRVPKVLLTGNHQRIDEWRHAEAVKRTKRRRPDLLSN